MQLISEEDLKIMGITLDSEEMKSLVQHANDILNEHVGADIIEGLNDEQLEEYVALQQSGDDEKTTSWLTENVPDLKEVVENERDIVLGELAENAERVQ